MLTPPQTKNNLINTVQELNNSLGILKPLKVENETTQIITYTLIATAVVGIFIYHYIKEQEAL